MTRSSGVISDSHTLRAVLQASGKPCSHASDDDVTDTESVFFILPCVNDILVASASDTVGVHATTKFYLKN